MEKENGKKNPGLDIFIKITDTLHVSADWLLYTDTPFVSSLLNDELHAIIADCSPTDAQFLIRILKEIKTALHAAQNKNNN